MYHPGHFSFDDKQAQFKFINQYGFGSLVTCYLGKLEINQLPFILSQCGQYLLTHLAKANNHWQNLVVADDLKVCFNGPDTYISPSWYKETKKNVPTWNYISVQVSGKANLMNDAELIDLLDKLSQKHEAQFDKPWRIDKLSSEQLASMCKVIVGVKISIDGIQGKAKLSQNKSEEDKLAIIRGLSTQSDPQSKAVLSLMEMADKTRC